MLVALLAIVVIALLIVVFVILRSGKKAQEHGEKLINRHVPPYETDTTKAGAADYE